MFPKEMIGMCSSCGKTIIDLKTPKFLPDYKEHYISLSDETLMKVAVCDTCKIQLVAGDSKKTAQKILKNHKEYWKEKAKKKTATYREKYGEIPPFFEKLEVENPNTCPRDFMRKLEKDKREQEELKSLAKSYGVGK